MKQIAILVTIFVNIGLLGCVTSNKAVSQMISDEAKFTFSEMYFDYNFQNGETIITFYNISEYFNKYNQKGTNNLYDDYLKVNHFSFYDEGFNVNNGLLHYRLLLKADSPSNFDENMTVLLSKILNKNVSVGFMRSNDMTKNAVMPWTISFDDFDNNMHYFDGNAVATYRNDELKVLFIFDLSRGKIEFGITYPNNIESIEKKSAEILMQRPFDYIGSDTKFVVMLDGEKMGEIGDFETIKINVTNGNHTIYTMAGLQKSNEINFTINSEQIAFITKYKGTRVNDGIQIEIGRNQ
jgi:hypothetical protein